MKTVSFMIIFLGCVLISSSFSNAVAQTLVPGMHGISTLPGVKFVWVIISNDHELSLNIRYAGNGTTPPVALTATAFANPKATDGFLNQTSIPTTIGTSLALKAGWISPSSIVLTFDENPSLFATDIITVVASPNTAVPQTASPDTSVPQTASPDTSVPKSGCDKSYPDFCIPPPPPQLNCDKSK